MAEPHPAGGGLVGGVTVGLGDGLRDGVGLTEALRDGVGLGDALRDGDGVVEGVPVPAHPDPVTARSVGTGLLAPEVPCTPNSVVAPAARSAL
ncbi:hypothetical protein Raf01_55820 [Rugosimonospora africana]|uniref:Uncharacterized protein n=1 Tax=Rugosimonospora africana TaxID=556532 RepID=A0A8J3VSR4_9ACTN|nr:hypothetical protein Raf01_55820 [Rugosimonospora africana]